MCVVPCVVLSMQASNPWRRSPAHPVVSAAFYTVSFDFIHLQQHAHGSEGRTLETGQCETLLTSVTVLRMEDNSYNLKPQTHFFPPRLFGEIGYCCQPCYRLSLIFSKKVIKKFPLVPKRGRLIVRLSFSPLSYPVVPIWLRLAHCAALVVLGMEMRAGSFYLLSFRICIVCCEDWWEWQQDKS